MQTALSPLDFLGPQGLAHIFGLQPRGRDTAGVDAQPGLLRTNPAASAIGAARGLPRLLDSLNLGAGEPLADGAVAQLFELQLSVSITRAGGAALPAADLPGTADLPGAADLSPEATAGRIVDFARGLFDIFAAQNPELSREEAFAEFGTVVPGAIDEGVADAEAILEGLGQLNEANRSLLADIRAAIDARLAEAFADGPGEAGETAETDASSAATQAGLPAASEFGIVGFEQVNINVSLQLAQARIGVRGAEALGEAAPQPAALDLFDTRSLDDLLNDLFALADDLLGRLSDGEGLLDGDGLRGLLDRVLEIFGGGFEDALGILDQLGGTLLPDGTNADEVFAFALDAVELNISQTRIQTADGTVIEQTSISLNVTQVRIVAAAGETLAPEQPATALPAPETPEDVAQNVLDFASGLFGIFRAQHPGLDDEQALAEFVALVRDAAARGAGEARGILDGLNALDDAQSADIDAVLAALDALLAERFPESQLLTP